MGHCCSGKGNTASAGSATLKIEGLSCGHCVMRVEKAVGGMAGVTSAKVDLAKKEGVFTFDPAVVKVEDIKAKIVEAGYKI